MQVISIFAMKNFNVIEWYMEDTNIPSNGTMCQAPDPPNYVGYRLKSQRSKQQMKMLSFYPHYFTLQVFYPEMLTQALNQN